MNLNLLFWSAKQFTQPAWYEAAHAHALGTAANFLRPDGSTFHVVEFHDETGEVLERRTHQGYADDSCWSRGQAWAVYGFTESYRHTRDPELLRAATRAADYFIDRLPEDAVPYWDFNAPVEEGREQPRDTSAGAIAASGLLELSLYTGEKESRYYGQAQRILKSLASDTYLTRGDPKAKISSLLLYGTIGNPDK
ncbi:Six-hairpin glycosidase-like protein [Jimgerdemannia flammicorona]|nr:Six-hairpin glycosidase-like protein [Jimgerdemannia flammicorona]